MLGLEPGCFPKLAEALSAGGEFAVRHGRLALASWQPVISGAQSQLREKLLARLAAAGANAPARGDLLKELGCTEGELRQVVKLLVEECLVSVLGSHLILRSVVENCRGKLLELFKGSPTLEIGAFRKATGLSRNLAVAVLEHFDSQGLTRRSDEGRVLAKAPAPLRTSVRSA